MRLPDIGLEPVPSPRKPLYRGRPGSTAVGQKVYFTAIPSSTMVPPSDDDPDPKTLLRGGAAGLVAFLLGYVLTYAWKAPAVDESLRGINAVAELLGGQAVPTWKAVGWLFFNAHVVATRVPALGGGQNVVNFIDASDDGSLVLLYVLIPVVLVLAGAAVARYGRSDRLGTAAASGAAIVVGYLPAAVALALLVGHTFGGGATVAPDLVTAVAVAGVLYPAFFGALGGAVWQGLASTLTS